jgi:hypothetical protein
MEKRTNDDVEGRRDMGIHPKAPDLPLHETSRHSYQERRKMKKLKKTRMQNKPNNFTFDKMRRKQLRPRTPHNTSQYLIANHTREAIGPMVSLFSEYMIDDGDFFIEAIDDICITGGTMRKIVKCRDEGNICIHQIYDNVIEMQRKMIESLEQQIQERRTI